MEVDIDEVPEPVLDDQRAPDFGKPSAGPSDEAKDGVADNVDDVGPQGIQDIMVESDADLTDAEGGVESDSEAGSEDEGPRRSSRVSRQVDYGPVIAHSAIVDPGLTSTPIGIFDPTAIKSPKSTKQINASPYKQQWLESDAKELQAIEDRGVWEHARMPTSGVKPLGTIMVRKVKINHDGTLDKFKSRLTARGDQEDVRDEPTFAPVASRIAIRALLACAVFLGLLLFQYDVATAFLYAKLNNSHTYVYYPEGYPNRRPGHCLRLKRALYGLRSSPRAWWVTIHAVLKTLGFCASPGDPCFYVFRGSVLGSTVVILLALFVDDLAVACQDPATAAWFRDELRKHFEVEDRSPMEWLLGMRITATKGLIMADQTMYIVY
jgi:hypothetical protein